MSMPTDKRILPSVLLVVGVVAMPLVYYLTAIKKGLLPLFSTRVGCLVMAVTVFNIVLLAGK